MVYIVVLNYKNWKDTIECLESLFKLEKEKFKIIVCDNNSLDGSLEYIEEWAKGDLIIDFNEMDSLKSIVYPFIKKPISYKKIDKYDINNNFDLIKENLILIQNDENKGYSAGNNIGIKYALNQEDCEYIWVLNNDTIVDRLSLYYLVDFMKKNLSVGICGAKTYFYYEPYKIQCEGGFYYNKWLAYPFKRKYSKKNLSYINGASMFVRKNFILDVGLLSEDYFLYYEEIDWVLRGKNKYEIGYCSKSKIYHKEGGSINKNEKKSLLSDFYAIRNRIVVTRKFYKYCLPTVYIGILIAVINRIRRKQYKRAWMFLKIMLLFGNCKYK